MTKVELRFLVIPFPILMEKDLTTEEKLLLALVGSLMDDSNNLIVDYGVFTEILGVDKVTVCSRISSLVSKGFLVKDKIKTNNFYTPVLSLSNRTMGLYQVYRSEKQNGNSFYRSEKQNGPSKIEKELIREKEISNNTKIEFVEKEEIKTEEEKDPSPSLVISDTPKGGGKLFTTLYGDKNGALSNQQQKKQFIAHLFTYSKLQFSQYNFSDGIISAFNNYLTQMLGCRKINSEQVKALVGQLVKFKISLGYADEEIIEIIGESMLRSWLYFREIKDLQKYRELKSARLARLEKDENNKSTDNPDRKKDF